MTVKSIGNIGKNTQAANHLFEAEVEYVLDELQNKAYRVFGEESVCVPTCAAEIGFRMADILPGGDPGRYWLHDMGMIVIQIMSVMEFHGYKLSEEILEILSQADQDFSAETARKRKLTG